MGQTLAQYISLRWITKGLVLYSSSVVVCSASPRAVSHTVQARCEQGLIRRLLRVLGIADVRLAALGSALGMPRALLEKWDHGPLRRLCT